MAQTLRAGHHTKGAVQPSARKRPPADGSSAAPLNGPSANRQFGTTLSQKARAATGGVTLTQERPSNGGDKKWRRLRVVYESHWFWGRRFATFLFIFTAVWLFVEPLFSFRVGSSLLRSLGPWGYAGLLILTLLATLAVELFSRWRSVQSISFIRFEVILTEIGARYRVEAPEDMKVSAFVVLFLKKVSGSGVPKRIHAVELGTSFCYDNDLLVNRAQGHEKLARHKTLGEAGLSGGDVCKIQGEIKPEYACIYYHVETIRTFNTIMAGMRLLAILLLAISFGLNQRGPGHIAVVTTAISLALQAYVLLCQKTGDWK